MTTEHKPHTELVETVRKGIGSTWTSDEATNKRGYREAMAALSSLEEQFEALRNFAEACCVIIERSRNPVEEIAGRLDDMRAITYPVSRATAPTGAVSPAPGHQRSDLPESPADSSPASQPDNHTHVWKPLLDGNDFACIVCGAIRSEVQSPAKKPDE